MTLFPAGLSMLWEDVDPVSALRDRFGFTGLDSLHRWLTASLAEVWGVEVVACERAVISGRNALAWLHTTSSPARVIAKWSVAESVFATLEQTTRLTTWLAAAGLPVSQCLPAADGRFQVVIGSGPRPASMQVQHLISADHLDVSAPAQVRAAGAVLARLHLALADYPAAPTLMAAFPPRDLGERIGAWLDSDDERFSLTHPAAAAVSSARGLLRDAIAGLPAPDAPVQLVCLDYRSANILVDDDAVVGLLDLEQVRPDHPVVDLARASVMLGTQFRQWGPAPREVRAALIASYSTVRNLTAAEERWLVPLQVWTCAQLMPPGPDDPNRWVAALADLLTYSDMGR